MSRDQYKKLLAKPLNIDDQNIFLYWKGRVALYALLQAMDVSEGDEVIVPAYTCVVVANAIKYIGAMPVYVDIDADTYTMDIDQVEVAITERTKVIICQNTYGLSTDLEALNAIAKAHQLYTIEDCTHGYGGQYNQKPNGTFCDAAFFSSQWNKPFSSGIGGFAITQNPKLREKLVQINQGMSSPSLKDSLVLKLLFFVKRYLVNDVTFWPMIRLYRFLSRYNLVIGSSNGIELEKPVMPEGFFKGFSDVQVIEGMRDIQHLTEYLQLRRKQAEIYTDLLERNGKKHVSRSMFENHSFLKYPILVHDRKKFFQLAEKNQISLGDWFISPLHPIKVDLTPWGFHTENFPIASHISKHVVNLPTTQTSSKKVVRFLEQYMDEIQ